MTQKIALEAFKTKCEELSQGREQIKQAPSEAIDHQIKKLEVEMMSLLEARKIVTGETGSVDKEINVLKQVVLSLYKEKKEADETSEHR